MKFEIGAETVLSYKRLSYKAWYAIAEFVDNSTQSYFDHEKALKKAYATEGSQLEVSITYDANARVLRVVDNAFGMSEDELDRAVKVGKAPPNTSGRSEFGMGLKTAACWFGDEWTVTTKQLGHDREYSVTVSVPEIAKGSMDLKVTSRKKPPEGHYTMLEIRLLHNKINGWGIRNITECLGSIYRQDLRDGTLHLMFNDAAIKPPFTATDDSFLQRADGTPYRATVSTTIGGKKVTGYLGVLAPGFAARRHAGFAILRRGRCVQGWYDAWKPEEIFGAAGRNDLINQRLTGELVMDQFAASHTKDAIIWTDDDESELIKYLESLAKTHELIHIARTHRGPDSVAFTDDDVKTAIKKLEVELTKSEVVDAIRIEEVPPPELQESKAAALEKQGAEGKPDIRIPVGDNLAIEILFLDGHQMDPYYSYSILDDHTLRVLINMSHPGFTELPSSDAIEAFVKHCAFDAIAEWKCRLQESEVLPDSVKVMKDNYFRISAAVGSEST